MCLCKLMGLKMSPQVILSSNNEMEYSLRRILSPAVTFLLEEAHNSQKCSHSNPHKLFRGPPLAPWDAFFTFCLVSKKILEGG
jgi:hypothetical protein